MSALLPRTLFGQTLLTLLVGIGLALGAGAWIYASARQEAVRAVGALAAAERIVNLARLVAEMPPQWRRRIVEGSSDPTFRVELREEPPAMPMSGTEPAAAAAIAAMLGEALPGRQVAVTVYSADRLLALPHWREGRPRGPGAGLGDSSPGHHGGDPHAEGLRRHAPLARRAMSWRGLEAAVELPDGPWIAFATTLPDTGPAMSPRLLIALLVASAMIAALTAWAVRRTTSPLRLLSDAAERLGRDVQSAPLSVTGTLETQRAATAFNEMQARLRRLVENRTLMLAAISHDLRTELTLLRLRAEAIEPADDRERILATIGGMEAMLTATLSFAREEAASEAPKRTDVGALVNSIVDDLADAGRPVQVVAMSETTVADVKPVALRRALANLIDNAVKYGKRADVSLESDATGMTIVVDDEGPGISEDDLFRVQQPFVRLDPSRNRDSGGMGLGLAIAASVADAHGGTLHLANRLQGGLRATLALPAPKEKQGR